MYIYNSVSFKKIAFQNIGKNYGNGEKTLRA